MYTFRVNLRINYYFAVKRIELAGISRILAEPHHGATIFLDLLERPISIGHYLEIDTLSGQDVPENQNAILEQPTGGESETEQARQEAINRTAMKSNEAAEEKRIDEERNKFVGLR